MSDDIPKIVIKVETPAVEEQVSTKLPKIWIPEASHIFIVVVALLTAFLLLPPVKGMVVQVGIERALAGLPEDGDVTVTLSDYELGYMRSSVNGSLLVHERSGDILSFDFSQEIQHGIDIFSPWKIDSAVLKTQFKVPAALGAREDYYFPDGNYLSATTHYQGGTFQTEFFSSSFEAASHTDLDINIKWGGLNGKLVSLSTNDSYELNLSIPRLEITEREGDFYKLEGLTLNLKFSELTFRNIFSNVDSSIAAFASNERKEKIYIRVNDAVLTTDTVDKGQQFDWASLLKGGKFEYDIQGRANKGLSFSYGFAFRNIHKPTFEKLLQQILSAAENSQNESDKEWQRFMELVEPSLIGFLQTTPEFQITNLSADLASGEVGLEAHVIFAPQLNRSTIDYKRLVSDAKFDLSAHVPRSIVRDSSMKWGKRSAEKVLAANQVELTADKIQSTADAITKQAMQQIIDMKILVPTPAGYRFELTNMSGKLLLNGEEEAIAGIQKELLAYVESANK